MNFYGWHRLNDINQYFKNLKLPFEIKKDTTQPNEAYNIIDYKKSGYIKISPIPHMCGALFIHNLYSTAHSTSILTALDALAILTGYSQLLAYWSEEENKSLENSEFKNNFKIIDSFTNYRTKNLIYVLSKKYNYDNDTYHNDFEDHFDNIFKQSQVEEKNV